MRTLGLVLLAAIVSAPAYSQSDTFFSEVMEIRVTNVDVIVTGRDGKPVTGLTREDFELYEDGVRKDISNFLEIRGDLQAALTPATEDGKPLAAADDIRRRDITIFIDNVALHPLRRNVILPHLRTFLAESVRPGDTVAIIVSGHSLKLALEPTSNRAAMEAAVDELAKHVTVSTGGDQLREDFHRAIEQLIRAYKDRGELPPWSQGIAEARMYAMRLSHDIRRRVEALKAVLSSRRGVDGRKVLVYLTEALPQNPAEAEFMYLDSIRSEFNEVNSSALAEGREFEMPHLVSEVVEAANSSGVTLYPIDAAGKDSGMMNRDASVNVRTTPSGAVTQGTMLQTLRSMAGQTGGMALEGSSNWKLAFDTISNDLETYYSLGYRSDGPRQDRMKNIQVKLKNKRLNVRTRNAVIERTVTSEMQDAVSANLFRSARDNDLAIKAVAGGPQPKDAEAVVIPVTITIPMDKLTLLPEGTDLTGRFSIFAAFLRKDGAVSKVAQAPQAFRFPAESLPRRKEITFKLDVTTDANTNGISVGVMDEVSRATGFASVKVPGSASE
ncbi:MAG TPA: VWA domain-containing protein [Thermoanaerobaculia bacterium]|nr:VWA domain-containing protein [Thermoanaerobaculia bacterium]